MAQYVVNPTECKTDHIYIIQYMFLNILAT